MRGLQQREPKVSRKEHEQFDRLRPTPASSSFRKPLCSRSKSCSSEDESDDDAPVGLRRAGMANQENARPENLSSSSFFLSKDYDSSRDEGNCWKINDEDNRVDGAHISYIPPPCSLIHRQTYHSPSMSRSLKLSTNRFRTQRNISEDITGFRYCSENSLHQKLLDQMEKDYARDLTVLRNEQLKRQQSQQKEFEDGKKFRLQCEEFEKDMLRLCDGLAHVQDLDKKTGKIRLLREKMEEVYFDQIREGKKQEILCAIQDAERKIATHRETIKCVKDFFTERKGMWVNVFDLKRLLTSTCVSNLRNQNNEDILFYDKIQDTLELVEEFVDPMKLDSNSVAYLNGLNIRNISLHKSCSEDECLRKLMNIDYSEDLNTLEYVAEVGTQLTHQGHQSIAIEEMSQIINKKLSCVKAALEFLQEAVAVISGHNELEDAVESLRATLASHSAEKLKLQKNKTILFLERVLQCMDQSRCQDEQYVSDEEVIKYLRKENPSLLPHEISQSTLKDGLDPALSSHEFLGSDMQQHESRFNEVLSAVPEEYRLPYSECLDKCIELHNFLRDRGDAPGEKRDSRNERRSLICQSYLFIHTRLVKVQAPSRDALLSHLLELLISISSSKDLMLVSELSIIPNSLCQGSLDKFYRYQKLLKTSSPACWPKISLSTAREFDRPERIRIAALFASQTVFCVDLNAKIGLGSNALESILESVWRWIVACGSTLMNTAGDEQSNAENVNELCGVVKVFLDIAGSVVVNYFGPRLKQLLVGPFSKALNNHKGKSVERLKKVIEGLEEHLSLSCILDMWFISPFSMFARIKKCEWDNIAAEWTSLSSTLKKDVTDVKKIVGRAFNQLGTDVSGLTSFQDNMGKLKQLPAMQNANLRSKILFFLCDKALSACRDFKPGTAGKTEDIIVAPLANAFVWLLGSQKGMSDIFLKGLCRYCPFVYQMSMAVSEDDEVNKIELGYIEKKSGTAAADEAKEFDKWQCQMKSLLAFYATLIVLGHESQVHLNHFCVDDAWEWLSRTVNFCVRNRQHGLPNHVIWMLYVFINISSRILAKNYGKHFFHTLRIIENDILTHVCKPKPADLERLKYLLDSLKG